MTPRRELVLFAASLAALVGAFFAETLVGRKILSPADVLAASPGFEGAFPGGYEPGNRLLMDPTLQFEPWIEFNRAMLRSGRLPLWNSAAGCGAPHLANGQAAVFDPFNAIAYLGAMPGALAWMAAARLWFAGMGMFLLARAWTLGPWGRWFAGLAFPFCGFLVGWLLYPVTNAAVWLPWAFLATAALHGRPTLRRAGALAIALAGPLLGGHVQTAAHVLLATGCYAAWLVVGDRRVGRFAVAWGLGAGLGIALAAVEVVPLGAYLTRSPVWGDRDRERVAPWKLARPRLLEAVCIAFPSLYGSQRRGEPGLAKAVGADNQNESAGGFAGLPTLLWLAPLGALAWRGDRRVAFLAALTLFGAAASARLPGVDNLLRSVPVLKVTDNRRMSLWVAFGLVTLGAFGMDRLAATGRGWGLWGACWVAGAIALLVAAVAVPRFAPTIEAKARAHYAKAAAATPGADPTEYRDRADRQTAATLRFVPRYLTLGAAELIALAALLMAARRGRLGPTPTRATLLGLTLADLLRFGVGLNPAIDPALDRPEPPLIAALSRVPGPDNQILGRGEAIPDGRILGVGEAIPPNVAMRYGLRDVRNYDSVETGRNLDWLAPIYDPTVREQTSRRDVSWERVDRARDRLRRASVRAVVGPTPPPPSFDRVERFGSAWVAWLDYRPIVDIEAQDVVVTNIVGTIEEGDGRFLLDVEAEKPSRLVVRETFDPGWRATVDGVPAAVEAVDGTFLGVRVGSGRHVLALDYDPVEVRAALWISGGAAVIVVFALTGSAVFRSTRWAVHGLDGPRPSG